MKENISILTMSLLGILLLCCAMSSIDNWAQATAGESEGLLKQESQNKKDSAQGKEGQRKVWEDPWLRIAALVFAVLVILFFYDKLSAGREEEDEPWNDELD